MKKIKNKKDYLIVKKYLYQKMKTCNLFKLSDAPEELDQLPLRAIKNIIRAYNNNTGEEYSYSLPAGAREETFGFKNLRRLIIGNAKIVK